MNVLNIHQRALPVAPERVGELLDTLATRQDRLWPRTSWPAMRFDQPLAPGAAGGHGPIRYRISHYVPGRWIRFTFTAPRGFDGFHQYEVHTELGQTVLRHTVCMHARGLARLSWPVVYRPLHDALIEDSLDLAERAATGDLARPARWSGYVRLLRWCLGRRAARPRAT